MKILVTGAAGFIGKHFYKAVKELTDWEVKGLDGLYYAADVDYAVEEDMFQCDISNEVALSNVFEDFNPDYLLNFAAESHVDNSIEDPSPFFSSNVLGVLNLLKLCHEHNTIFHQISTDEVFGDRHSWDSGAFHQNPATLNSPYVPSSPYAASKASADMLVMAWARTYRMRCGISYCTNNFGPSQHEEKFIPKVIKSINEDKYIPLYGTGLQVRQWVYVLDHVADLINFIKTRILDDTLLVRASFGTGFCVSNRMLINYIGNILKKTPKIEHVTDRLGHDYEYHLADEPYYTQPRPPELGRHNKFNNDLKETIWAKFGK